MLIDAHVHCGIQDLNPKQDFETIARLERAAGVEAVAATPPVMEVYDRHNPTFADGADWQARRARANQYLLDLSRRDIVPKVYPFVFVWNDFRIDELDRGYVGVKWHRHADEPRYEYESPACEAFLAAVAERGLPILLEEELRWTVHILDRVGARCPVIIPHIGHLNGGFDAIAAESLWERDNVYTDLSGGRSVAEVRRYLDRCGPERLLFGSDYPFSTPVKSAETLAALPLSDAGRELVSSGNFLRVIA